MTEIGTSKNTSWKIVNVKEENEKYLDSIDVQNKIRYGGSVKVSEIMSIGETLKQFDKEDKEDEKRKEETHRVANIVVDTSLRMDDGRSNIDVDKIRKKREEELKKRDIQENIEKTDNILPSNYNTALNIPLNQQNNIKLKYTLNNIVSVVALDMENKLCKLFFLNTDNLVDKFQDSINLLYEIYEYDYIHPEPFEIHPDLCMDISNNNFILSFDLINALVYDKFPQKSYNSNLLNLTPHEYNLQMIANFNTQNTTEDNDNDNDIESVSTMTNEDYKKYIDDFKQFLTEINKFYRIKNMIRTNDSDYNHSITKYSRLIKNIENVYNNVLSPMNSNTS